MPRSPARDTAVASSFETALAELERIVAGMEGGQLSLAESLANYKRGAELLGYCQGQLQAVQEQVKVLEEGALKPFVLEPPGGRSRGRASGADSEDEIDEC